MKNLKSFLLWAVFILYYVFTVTQHITVTDIVINPLETSFGSITISSHMQSIGVFCSVVLLLFIILRCINGHKRFVTTFFWILWALSVFLHHETFLFSLNSYVHYPQYIIFTILLSFCIDRKGDKMPFARLMFWSVAAGSIDELAQYLYICADVAGHYFDFNDIFLNAQGSVAGLLIRYGYKSETDIKRVSRLSFKDIFKRFFNSFEGRISIAAASMVFILFLSGFIRITPPGLLPAGSLPVIKEEKTLFLERHPGKMGRWNRGPVGRYYIMTAFEGTLVTIIYVMFFCSLALFYRSGKSIKGSYNMKG